MFFLIQNESKFEVIEANGFKPKQYLCEVPSSISKDDHDFVVGEQIDAGNGEMIWQAIVDDVAKGNAITEKTNSDFKSAAHASYIADIDAEMKNIFGTTDRDKANALYNTWYEWLKDPSYFADKGLLDDQGLPMDTSGKIYTHAQMKINLCKDYSVFLIQREKQFRDAIAGL